jgi:hypothetical protein
VLLYVAVNQFLLSALAVVNVFLQPRFSMILAGVILLYFLGLGIWLKRTDRLPPLPQQDRS